MRWFAGGTLVGLSFLCHPWLVGRLLSEDGEIEDRAVLVLAYGVFFALVGFGLVVGMGRWRLLWAPIMICLATLVLVWPNLAELQDRVEYRLRIVPRQSKGHQAVGLLQGIARRGEAVLGGATSQVFVGPGDSDATWQADVAADMVLDTAIGIEPQLGSLTAGTATFMIAIKDPESGVATTLVQRTLEVEGANEGWTELSLPLESVVGAGREFVFERSAVVSEELPFNLSASDFLHFRMPRIRSKKQPSRRNVLLVSLDTVRADHLSLHGYGRPTSPSLEAIASEGVVFERCYSQSPWTLPAHMSIFTSTYPNRHRAGLEGPGSTTRWRDDLPTLASLLRDEGYLTAAITGRGAISAHFGLNKGFDSYDESGLITASDIEEVFSKAVDWLDRNRDRTFFLFLHTYEPHRPYDSETFLRDEGLKWSMAGADERRKARYDGDIQRADDYMGRLMRRLAALDLDENTVIVVTSDHGEEFHSDGRRSDALLSRWPHGLSLFDEQLHVPLLFRGLPGVEFPARLTTQVRSIDIAPTILDYLGIGVPGSFQGESLRSVLDDSDSRDRPVVSEGTAFGPGLVGIRTQDYKYIFRTSYGSIADSRSIGLDLGPLHQLYDLAQDPGEQQNVALERPETVEEMQRLLVDLAGSRDFVGSLGQGAASDGLNESEKDSLRALGYLD